MLRYRIFAMTSRLLLLLMVITATITTTITINAFTTHSLQPIQHEQKKQQALYRYQWMQYFSVGATEFGGNRRCAKKSLSFLMWSSLNHNDGISGSTGVVTTYDSNNNSDVDRNTIFIKGLMENNLKKLCDSYICNGSPKIRKQIFRVLEEVDSLAVDRTLVQQALRICQRAGVPMHKSYIEKFKLNINDQEAVNGSGEALFNSSKKKIVAPSNSINHGGRSAFPRRMSSIPNGGQRRNVMAFQNDMNDDDSSSSSSSEEAITAASLRVSKILAKAGNFDGKDLGVGGLDDVLSQIKRRIWTPLAAPPQLLKELGISPARGLLLFGKPGCGKTLIASVVGKMLSPFRPVTVVSGPEILDKFVGSSEKNLRNIFDQPPDIYPQFLTKKDNPDETDVSTESNINASKEYDPIAKAALHVIIMDEFDAIARSRGGADGNVGQGDAGVARDSVVNQLLAKMDGVQQLVCPTLVIGLTNKRSLIEPALLRPGRFEVQIEIPPPKTIEQRVSILKVHTKHMHAAGRLEVSDPKKGTIAGKMLLKNSGILPYDELLMKLADDTDGFSGAAIAGVSRAAASHSLERAIEQQQLALTTFSDDEEINSSSNDIMNCLVTQKDLYDAVKDVRSGMGNHDHTDDDDGGALNDQRQRQE